MFLFIIVKCKKEDLLSNELECIGGVKGGDYFYIMSSY